MSNLEKLLRTHFPGATFEVSGTGGNTVTLHFSGGMWVRAVFVPEQGVYATACSRHFLKWYEQSRNYRSEEEFTRLFMEERVKPILRDRIFELQTELDYLKAVFKTALNVDVP